MKRNEFLLTPGPLPWRVDCMSRNPKSGAVYDADGRLVCVTAIGNAREIVRMSNLFKDCEVESPGAGRGIPSTAKRGSRSGCAPRRP